MFCSSKHLEWRLPVHTLKDSVVIAELRPRSESLRLLVVFSMQTSAKLSLSDASACAGSRPEILRPLSIITLRASAKLLRAFRLGLFRGNIAVCELDGPTLDVVSNNTSPTGAAESCNAFMYSWNWAVLRHFDTKDRTAAIVE